MTVFRNLLFLWIAVLLSWNPLAAAEPPGGKAVPARTSPLNGREPAARPAISVTPRELDLGAVAPGAETAGILNLKNMGVESLNWTAGKPEGWYCLQDQQISGTLEKQSIPINVKLKYVKGNGEEGGVRVKSPYSLIILTVESDNRVMTCRKELMPGTYREPFKIASSAGARTVYLRFKVVPAESEPMMEIFPMRIDLGHINAGEQISRKIELTNKGKDILRWTVEIPASSLASTGPDAAKRGRYISFMNESVRGARTYAVPVSLKEGLEIFGLWSEENGYPMSAAPNSTLRYRFSGRGIAVLFWKNPGGGNLSAYVDDKLMIRHDCRSEHKEEMESVVIDGLADGLHTLTLMSQDGHVAVEGVRILGREIMKGAAGWLRAFPISGRTSRQTHYITVSVNAQHLNPGWYSDYVVFNSNGGKKMVEVSLEVSADNVPRFWDVYRYVRGYDYFLTTNPQAEAGSLQAGAYQKQGIAFRLFSTGTRTPGTTNFHRWYNPHKGDRFYSSDPRGGGKSLSGYIYEGVIGNIATSRLSRTKELYRWYNASSGHHYYTTDSQGGGMKKKGYRFDGIAGYVP